MNRVAFVIPYFNPVGYHSHLGKLALSLQAFRRAGIIEQVFLAGAGGPAPSGPRVLFWDDTCPFIWHKERLINLSAGLLPPDYTHIVWVDSDVLVPDDWGALVLNAFERARLIQCFQFARYRLPDGGTSRTRVGWLHSDGRGGSSPGLAWGAHRDFFSGGPGLFELALAGGADTLLARTAARSGPDVSTISWVSAWSPEIRSRFHAWVRAVRVWLAASDRPGPVATEATIEVVEHGPLHARAYVNRQSLLADVSPDRHLHARAGRVLRWTPLGQTSVEPRFRTYFHERREDDAMTFDVPGVPPSSAPLP
ncbi:hypothetical protein AB0D74_41455 [Streptomyces sp. NPDC048278]|uniref:hypothetical protein n=1 Tax=Streptomyces sp. NPDC048278 TaxID=3155809 RepID=UPI0034460B78